MALARLVFARNPLLKSLVAVSAMARLIAPAFPHRSCLRNNKMAVRGRSVHLILRFAAKVAQASELATKQVA